MVIGADNASAGILTAWYGKPTQTLGEGLLVSGGLTPQEASIVYGLADMGSVAWATKWLNNASRLPAVVVKPGGESTKSFHNLYPDDVPRVPNIIPNERLHDITQRDLAYVVKEDGTLVVGKKDNFFQGHVDLAGGKPVLAAGEFTVIRGELRYINNASGHYRPSGIEAQRAAEEAFRRAGFNVEGKYTELGF